MQGIHLVQLNTVSVPPNLSYPLDKSILAKSGAEFPFAVLVQPANHTATYYAGTIRAVKIEGCKSQIFQLCSRPSSVNFALFAPFFYRELGVLDSLTESVVGIQD